MNKSDVYIISGMKEDREILTDCYKLNIRLMNLTKISPIKIGRSAFGIAFVMDHIYVISGANKTGYIRECERYSVKTDTWEDFTPLPSYQVAGSACSFENRYIYLIGGYNYDNIMNSRFEDSMHLTEIYRIDITPSESQAPKWESI